MINKVLIIGLGGTGGYVVQPLARMLSALKFKGSIILADGDSFEEKNMDRQNLDPSGLSTNKAIFHATNMAKCFPSLQDQIEFIDSYLSKDMIEQIVTDGSLVINCVDNVAARKYVEDKIASLANGAHICTGNEKTTGQVQIYLKRNGVEITPSIYKQSPSFNDTNDDRSTLDCQQLANLSGGKQYLCANFMAAALAINYVNQLFTSWLKVIPTGTIEFDCNFNIFNRKDISEVIL